MLIGIFAGFFAMIVADYYPMTHGISGPIGIVVGLVTIALQRNSK